MFTNRELELLHAGLLALIGNANKAVELTAYSGGTVYKAITDYHIELRNLNSKVCKAMSEQNEKEGF